MEELIFENEVKRMQEDLERALKKREEDVHWGMVIDIRKCVACHACVISCKAENVTPPGVTYTIVMEKEVGRYPNVRKKFVRRPCMQCQKPPCVKVCPVKATWKRADGIVVIDYEDCIGCRYCINACPYGARTFDFGEYYTQNTPEIQEYERRESYEYGRKWPRKKGKSPIGNTRKCHFCLHRLKNGLLPVCVGTCIGRATYFGDLKDEKSLVSELLANERVMRLKEELGTEPSVYYLE